MCERALIVVVAFLACAAGEGATVTPVDCLTMIDPLTGRDVVGRGGQGSDAWRSANTIWDGERLRLEAARGETVAFQLVVTRAPGETITNIRPRLDLACAKNVRTWRPWCIWNVPEIAVPLEGTTYSFDLPSTVPLEKPLFEKHGYVAWAVGIEFTVDREAKSGAATGSVTLEADAGMPATTFPVDVRVHDFALPARPSLVVEMNSYGDYAKFLGRDVKSYLDMHRVMRRHRCTFTMVPYRQGGSLVAPFVAPSVERSSGNVRLQWDAFDEALSGLFDGSAFDDRVPLSHFVMPFCYNWPAPFSEFKRDRGAYRRANAEARRRFARHVLDRRWTDTVFQEFHNENPDVGAKCPWHLDEPRRDKDFQGHALYLGLFGEGFDASDSAAAFRYRIDVSQWQRVRKALAAHAPSIHDWSVSRDRAFLNAKTAPMFRKYADASGGWLFEYGEVSGFAAGGRPVNWSVFDEYARQCHTLRLDGYAQWCCDLWRTKGRNDASGPLTYSNAAGARDLVWPGTYFGQDVPLPSLRLKAIRESLNLFDYVAVAAARHPDRAEEIGEIVSLIDTRRSIGHFEAKRMLADMIRAE